MQLLVSCPGLHGPMPCAQDQCSSKGERRLGARKGCLRALALSAAQRMSHARCLDCGCSLTGQSPLATARLWQGLSPALLAWGHIAGRTLGFQTLPAKAMVTTLPFGRDPASITLPAPALPQPGVLLTELSLCCRAGTHWQESRGLGWFHTALTTQAQHQPRAWLQHTQEDHSSWEPFEPSSAASPLGRQWGCHLGEQQAAWRSQPLPVPLQLYEVRLCLMNTARSSHFRAGVRGADELLPLAPFLPQALTGFLLVPPPSCTQRSLFCPVGKHLPPASVQY